MAGRYTVVGAALLLIAIFNALSSVDAVPTLKDLMLQDQAAKQLAHSSPAPTQESTAPATPEHTEKASSSDSSKATPAPSVQQPQAGLSPKAAAAFAHVARRFQAPVKQYSSSSGSSAGHAALGTSAMIGIGVGVGVACLVAVGAVVGILVHLRRRKSKGTQLEKQKTYGGTE